MDATRSRNHIITFIMGASLFVVGSPCFPFGAHAPRGLSGAGDACQFVSAPIFPLEISLCVCVCVAFVHAFVLVYSTVMVPLWYLMTPLS